MFPSMVANLLYRIYGCVEAPKIGSTTRGIPARSGPWLATPFLFGIAGPTGDMGLVSQFVCV